MTEQSAPDDGHKENLQELATSAGTHSVQPKNEIEDPLASTDGNQAAKGAMQKSKSLVS